MIKTLFLSKLLSLHPVYISMPDTDPSGDNKVLNTFLKAYPDDFPVDSGLNFSSQNTIINN